MMGNLLLKIKAWYVNKQIEREIRGEPDYPCYHYGNPAPPGMVCFKCGLESQFDSQD